MGMKSPATERGSYWGNTSATVAKKGCLSSTPIGGTVAPCPEVG